MPATQWLKSILALCFLSMAAFPTAVQAQTCASYTYTGVTPSFTSTYSNRVTFVNNCADPAYVIMTTPADPLSEALWANATVPGNSITKSNVGQHYYFTNKIPVGGSQTMCLPDAGAASGNFTFSFGCTAIDTTNTGLPMTCLIGSDPGKLYNGMDTVFELSPGCKYYTPPTQQNPNPDNSQCTYNPSNPSATLTQIDYLDVSAVTGFSIPMGLTIADSATYQCTFPSRTLVADLATCPYENFTTLSTKYNCPEVGTANGGQGISLQLMNQTPGWTSYAAACISPVQWISAVSQHLPGVSSTCSVNTTPTGTPQTSGIPTIADWYGCTYMVQAGDDAYPLTCLTPGCGGPQCAVGPDGTAPNYDPGSYHYNTAAISRGKSVAYTNYVTTLKAMGNEVYTWMYDDGPGTLSCNITGASMTVTLCPGQAGQKPYDIANQTWSYNATTNRCVVDTAGTYANQSACMAANGKYACSSETESKAQTGTTTWVTATLNYCKPLDPATATAEQLAAAVSLAACRSSTCQRTGTVSYNAVAPQDLLLLGN